MRKHVKYCVIVVLAGSISTILSVSLNNIGIGKENALMVFLVGVLTVSSVTTGYIYGAIASVLSVLLFNYFFAEPLYTFLIGNAKDIMLLAFFLFASLLSSSMTSKFQHQAAIAKRNEETARLLYGITKGFLNVTGTEPIVHKAMAYVEDYMGCRCCVKLDAEDRIFCTSGLMNGNETGESTSYTIPIKGLSNQIGTIEILGARLPLSSENNMLLKTIAYQMALVLDREFIYQEREKIRIAMESEHLKSTLLRSISHDLRTPLTGIKGASELILDSFETLEDTSLKKLVFDIKEESTWLIKSVQNILDMTLISEGKMTLNKAFEAVDDLVNQALTHVPLLVSSGRIHVSMPDEIILICVDGRLMVHVLVNLLDNAYKHSGESTQVLLRVYQGPDNIVFEIIDNGVGIDLAIQDTLFDGFVTSNQNIADGTRGFGLGLAICKAIVTAHNGSISASNQVTGGAIFRIVLPTEEM